MGESLKEWLKLLAAQAGGQHPMYSGDVLKLIVRNAPISTAQIHFRVYQYCVSLHLYNYALVTVRGGVSTI